MGKKLLPKVVFSGEPFYPFARSPGEWIEQKYQLYRNDRLSSFRLI